MLFVFIEFAAKFSSAVECYLLQKVNNDQKLSEGFIRHALDEYIVLFFNIKNKIIWSIKLIKKN